MTISVLAMLSLAFGAQACEEPNSVSDERPVADLKPNVSTIDEHGFDLHRLPSPYQAGDTTLRILLPDRVKSGRAKTGKRYRVVYVLPVVEEGQPRYGDGLLEIKRLGFHNSRDLICVAPEFTAKPWFADHDLNSKKQDESHLIKTVLPFVQKHYPALDAVEGRLLIGFSKSGWGAFSLLLRHPNLFHKAVGWDIGIRVDVGPIDEAERAKRIAREWGTVQNFEAYRISSLIKTKGRDLGDTARLFYFSTEGKRAQGGAEIHRLLVQQKIPHRYVFEPFREHRWDSGWIPQAIGFLVDHD